MRVTVNQKASEWILKQPWLSQFMDNCRADGAGLHKVLFFLLGMNSPYTIDEAFTWGDTSEGFEFWDRVDEEMMMVSAEEGWSDFNTTIEI